MIRDKIIFLIISSAVLFCNSTFAKARYMTCPQKHPRVIRVPYANVMILEFPEKPKHSLPGKNVFDFQFIGKDIGIKALQSKGHANFFVYLGKKRCAFKLITTKSRSDDIVIVSYPKQKTVEAKYVK